MEATKDLKIRPLGNRVFIKRLDAESVTSGGIILPDKAKEKPQKGIILRVGDGAVCEDGSIRKMQTKKGDTVIFTSYGGTEIKVNDEEFLIMDESDIMVVIEK